MGEYVLGTLRYMFQQGLVGSASYRTVGGRLAQAAAYELVLKSELARSRLYQ